MQLHLPLSKTFLFDQNHFSSCHHTMHIMKIMPATNNSRCRGVRKKTICKYSSITLCKTLLVVRNKFGYSVQIKFKEIKLMEIRFREIKFTEIKSME